MFKQVKGCDTQSWALFCCWTVCVPSFCDLSRIVAGSETTVCSFLGDYGQSERSVWLIGWSTRESDGQQTITQIVSQWHGQHLKLYARWSARFSRGQTRTTVCWSTIEVAVYSKCNFLVWTQAMLGEDTVILRWCVRAVKDMNFESQKTFSSF